VDDSEYIGTLPLRIAECGAVAEWSRIDADHEAVGRALQRPADAFQFVRDGVDATVLDLPTPAVADAGILRDVAARQTVFDTSDLRQNTEVSPAHQKPPLRGRNGYPCAVTDTRALLGSRSSVGTGTQQLY
jgi:hypothetical protein